MPHDKPPRSHRPRVGLILCGCGNRDGSEIQETVLTLLALQEVGVETIALAPDKQQQVTFNYVSGKIDGHPRNMLHESARTLRGAVHELSQWTPNDLDAAIIPGGAGVAQNLCTYAVDGTAMKVDSDVERLLIGLHEAKKPIGAICIAPVLLAKLFGRSGARITVGTDAETAAHIKALGATHVDCPVDDIVVDRANLLVTTPAFMLGENAFSIYPGIRRLAAEVVRLVG